MRSQGVHPGAHAAADDCGRRVSQAAEVKYPRELVTLNEHVITRIKRLCDIISIYSSMHKNNAQIIPME